MRITPKCIVSVLATFCVAVISLSSPSATIKTGTVRDSILYISGDTRVIPSYAYKDRTDFREVRMVGKSMLREIGEYAFLGCVNLKKITLPPTLVKLGEGAFRECMALDTLIIPSKVTALPKALCSWAENLRYVSLPANLIDIGSHAFAYCRNLVSIDIPVSVAHIGSNVFSGCRSLKEVKLPPRMKELESYAFSDCVSLHRAVLPANANLLGELIFSGCINLRELRVPSTVPPPFDCDSYIFEPDEIVLYRDCVLIVPKGTGNAYRCAPGWKLFGVIVSRPATP